MVMHWRKDEEGRQEVNCLGFMRWIGEVLNSYGSFGMSLFRIEGSSLAGSGASTMVTRNKLDRDHLRAMSPTMGNWSIFPGVRSANN